jgi:hypothetical protein
MKLGSFSVGMPLYEVESVVTYQTVRTPTVFERTVMKLCGSYQGDPGAADMTLSQIFEHQLGVASATELVGPSVENLIYMGVLSGPTSQDYMDLRPADLALTADGVTFLERDRLPSRSQQTTVSHLYFPLSNSIKPHRSETRLSRSSSRPFIAGAVLEPSDCSALVRESVEKERHAWKTPNTEIHLFSLKLSALFGSSIKSRWIAMSQAYLLSARRVRLTLMASSGKSRCDLGAF